MDTLFKLVPPDCLPARSWLLINLFILVTEWREKPLCGGKRSLRARFVVSVLLALPWWTGGGVEHIVRRRDWIRIGPR